MNNSENINIPLPTSKINFLHEGFSDKLLLPSNELSNKTNKKASKDENISTKKNNTIKENISSNNNNNNKKESDLLSIDKSLLLFDEQPSNEKKNVKKKEKIKKKRYIVDNIDNIITKLSEPKLKLILQEYVLYGIVFLVCIYYWIFLFLTTTKFEQNYCYTTLNQLDSCSMEQICDYYDNKINVILYNSTYNLHNHSFKNEHNLIAEENRIINEYYRPFFLRYSQLLSKYKIFTKIQMDSMSDKINFAIFMSQKEKWNLFIRYYSLCNFETYYILVIIMIALGGGLGSIFFGILSDILGRRTMIRLTLLISTISTMGISAICILLDYWHYSDLEYFNNNTNIAGEDSLYIKNILSNVYAQDNTRERFAKYFIFLLITTFLLNSALWPLLKSCLALIVENSKGDFEALICFRKYNFVFGGLPPLFTSLIFTNLNNFSYTFVILSFFNLIAFIYSCFCFEESMRYYYEYCEWKKLTEVVLNIYKNDISDFTTLNEIQLKKFQKDENLKHFNNNVRKMNSYIKNFNDNNNENIVFKNTYFNDIKEKNRALGRNLKRNIDFIIKLDDVKSNPFLIITALTANRDFKKSKILILIILILLYITMDLFHKELLEPPYFTIKDLYIDPKCNYILNSILFIYLIINFLSNYFFYGFYQINCFKIVVVISLLLIVFFCIIYHLTTCQDMGKVMDLNQYNFYMLTYYNRDSRTPLLLFIIFLIFFSLNGVTFYVYLLILRISKTLYRCTFLAIHSLSLIASMVICECIYFNMEDYFLFLGSLILLCFLTFTFLSESKELINVMNDVKIDIFRQSKNKQKEKNN